ncbi:MAG: hypothetical protein IJA63_04265, partial [Akkermansia sp.]|nr:hypothetical protein [Akkermansia sp.]
SPIQQFAHIYTGGSSPRHPACHPARNPYKSRLFTLPSPLLIPPALNHQAFISKKRKNVKKKRTDAS